MSEALVRLDRMIKVPLRENEAHAGLFITLEGGDGSGKSTQAPLLAKWLRQYTGREVVETNEPGGTPLGKQLRRLIQHDDYVAPRAEALLYAADRAHHVATVVRPALARGALVVCDRYLDSSVAYQAAGRELPPTEIEQISLWATEALWPDITILFDVDDATAQSRLTGTPDRIESAGAEFRDRVRAGYEQRVNQSLARWLVIPASGSISEVATLVQEKLTPVIDTWLNGKDISGVTA